MSLGARIQKLEIVAAPIKADQQRTPAAAKGVVEEVPGDLRLARAGRPVDTEAQRVHLEATEQPHEPATQPREDLLLTRDMGVDVRHDVEGLPEEGSHRLGPGLPSGVLGPRNSMMRSGNRSHWVASTTRLGSRAAALILTSRWAGQ